MRRTVTAAAAALSAASFLIVPFSHGAGAETSPIDAYDAVGVAQAVELAFTVRPSIFEPLAQVGIPHARTELHSLGQGSAGARAALAYPGDLANSLVTCVPLFPGGPDAATLGIAEAKYPADECNPPEEEVSRGLRVPAEGDALLHQGRSKVSARLGEARAAATAQRISIPGILEIDQVSATTESVRTAKLVRQISRVVATGISIADGTLLIDTIASTSTAQSDGAEGSADAVLTIGEVTAVIGGVSYRASIDSRGVHLEAPVALPGVKPGLEQDLEQALDYQFGTLGIAQVLLAAGDEIVDETQAEASIGGLVVVFASTIPDLPIPDQVGEAQKSIEEALPEELREALTELTATRCPIDKADTPDPEPPCVNPLAAIPASGNTAIAAVSVAGTIARAFGAQGFTFELPPLPPPTDGFVPPTDGGFVFPPGNGFVPPDLAPPPTPTDAARSARLLGLVAEMPDWALAVFGAAFLVLAVGLGFVPSLRR